MSIYQPFLASRDPFKLLGSGEPMGDFLGAFRVNGKAKSSASSSSLQHRAIQLAAHSKLDPKVFLEKGLTAASTRCNPLCSAPPALLAVKRNHLESSYPTDFAASQEQTEAV